MGMDIPPVPRPASFCQLWRTSGAQIVLESSIFWGGGKYSKLRICENKIVPELSSFGLPNFDFPQKILDSRHYRLSQRGSVVQCVLPHLALLGFCSWFLAKKLKCTEPRRVWFKNDFIDATHVTSM